ncbi:PBP1A family penicillin-binding protein [Petroclostridium sp. X23]|uniref:transglycosylase domain-containing protein n=1 Tax=Petroclostridium sp. X23 TaxID=3045146 RepID=UPI0024AE1346|nr:PBP1A family penicillin-binding protein [Petroclostridium sp. X23]WHH59301.1 PBP1A family penicillin-binding protein [Petroclostridium sp. X23]
MSEKNTSPKKRQKTSKEKKGMFKTLSIFFKILLVVGLFAGVAAVGIIGGTLYGYIDTTKEVGIDDFKLNFTSFVYYIDPETNEPVELERLYGEENRIWVGINDMPENLKNAFIAIEDERFKTHFGVDIKRTLKATFNYIIKSNSSEGGSTITQQLIKNLSGDDDVSPKRKIQEMWRAYNLEKKYSKDQILELYLNTIYLSQGCNGVQAAANTYFGKDVSGLSLAEAASIAGITQFPTRYDPFLNPENNKKKQELVLKKMKELGDISESEYQQAINEELNFKKGAKQELTSKQSYFVDQVINDVLNDLQKEKGYSKVIASKMLYTGGLKIYATIDPKVQSAMDTVFKDPDLIPKFNTEIQPEASMLVLDPYTGQVKGMVGGRGEKTAKRTLNRATQTVRQPGSSIKPIGVYAPGLEYGIITPGTVFDDVPTTFNPGTPSQWTPKNYYTNPPYWGLSTVRRGVEWSMNIIAAKVLEKVGIDNSFNFLTQNLGVTSLVEREKRADGKVYTDKLLNSLSLGGLTDGISVLEMTAAYAPFVNKGLYTKPYTYTKVVDHEGKVILEKKKESQIAMSEQTAFLMTKMLEGVITSGTATYAKMPNKMPAAGKTGTTSDDKDRWFVGYTPYYVAATWFGYDDPAVIRVPGALGGRNPATVLWHAVMNEINKDLEVKDFVMPAGIVQAQVCIDSGQRPTELCYKDPRGVRVRTEYFKKGTEPKESCTVHVLEKVDKSNNMLANEYCPPELVEERVFIVRPKPYVPVPDRNGNVILPGDAKYELPAGEYCSEHGPTTTLPSTGNINPYAPPGYDNNYNNNNNNNTNSTNDNRKNGNRNNQQSDDNILNDMDLDLNNLND